MEDTIALAARHVIGARIRVIEQQNRVRALEYLGVDPRDEEYALDIFRKTLGLFEEHHRLIEARHKMLLNGEIRSPALVSNPDT